MSWRSYDAYCDAGQEQRECPHCDRLVRHAPECDACGEVMDDGVTHRARPATTLKMLARTHGPQQALDAAIDSARLGELLAQLDGTGTDE